MHPKVFGKPASRYTPRPRVSPDAPATKLQICAPSCCRSPSRSRPRRVRRAAVACTEMPRNQGIGRTGRKHKKSAAHNIHRQPKATTEPTVATEAPEPPAAPDTSPEMEVEPAAPDAQALATGAAARRRRAWCPTAQEPSTINHYHGCHRRRLRSSSPRPRSDLVPRLSSLQQRRGPRQGVQRRRAGGRGAASYRAVAPAHRAGPLHPEAACGKLPVSPCDPLG